MKDFGTSESPKSTRSSTTHWCPGRPGHPAFRHNIASSLRLHTGLPYDWTPRSDAPLGSPLAPSARRVSRVASRLPGTTRLRFALHGGQRLKVRADFSFLFSRLPCPIRHLHPSREQAFVAGAPSTTNTTRSTSPGWPFSLPKALYSRGFLRKAADFESQPATLSYPGFLSDSAIPLCFREGEHEAKSGSPRHTVPGDTGAWTRAPMRPSARAVSGVAGCRWRCSSTPGTPPIATVSRPSVMAPKAARSTRQAPPERYRVARA